jgi:carboxyl-terminal processing protease
MFRRCLFVCLLLTAGVAVRSVTAEPAPAKPAEPAFAPTLWAVSQVVVDNQIAPASRQQVLLEGVRKMLAKAGKEEPIDLARKMSDVTTREQFEILVKGLGELRPTQDVLTEVLESALATLPGRPHYYSPEAAKISGTVENNNYVGIGIQIRMYPDESLAGVIIPFPGGPFRRAGGKTNDVFVEVDGKKMAGLPLVDVVKALRGEEGSSMTTLVRQPGSTETRLLKMVREVIPFQSATGYRRVSEDAFDYHVDPGLQVAYVRLTHVTSSTYHELRRLDRQLRAEGYRAMVLDLRETRPGTMVHAAQVADALLDGGEMWKVRDAHGRVKEYKADRDCLFRDWPVAVLVNAGTVETAALIAGALQDRGRAVLVGSTAHTGGTVRSLELLPDGLGGVNLPTGIVERLKPAQRPGLTPDHSVQVDKKLWQELVTWHNSQESPEPPAAKAPEDPQLAKALDLLRGAVKEKEKTAG